MELTNIYSEKSMESLRSMSTPSARVLRDGVESKIASKDLVPGDIVIVLTGDIIPADLRLVEAFNLECNETMLTGEPDPAIKTPNSKLVFDGASVGDRANIAHSSTKVTKGRGRGIVVGTGMGTEFGKIAHRVLGKKEPRPGRDSSFTGTALRVYDSFGTFLGVTEGTPLQRKLAKLAYTLLLCAILLAVIVFAVNKFKVTHEVTIYAISLGEHPLDQSPIYPRQN